MEDREIIKLFVDRSQEAITETKNKYEKFCYKIANNILKNHHDVEECLSDMYLKAWETIPPNIPNSLKAYLGKIIRNGSINLYHYKNAKKRGNRDTDIIFEELEECIHSNNGVESYLDTQHITEVINNFLEESNRLERQIFVRRYWYMESILEIANACDISDARIKTILFRQRKKLKKYLEKEGVFI